MTSLKRSFFYTLIIFIVLLLIVYLIAYYSAEQKPYKRTKINPAKFLSKTEQQIQKDAGSQEPSKEKLPPQKRKKPLKTQKEQTKKIIKEKTNKQTKQKHKKKSSKKIPTINKKKKLNLPDSSNELLEALGALPEAVEAAPQLTPEESMLQEVYGDEITRLSTTAKKYLMDNHLKMQIITQRVLNRIGRVYIDPRFHYYAYNYVEFTLYPDGHISKIKILKDAGFQLLDKITKETIETAFKDYPLPTEPILVRYKFLYDLRSY